jgi:4-nitrophenyl phosphatase
MCKENHDLTSRPDLDAYDCYVFDCDGVLWHGHKVIPGAIELVTELHKRNKHVYFVTNASKRSRQEVYEKFQALGFETVEPHQCYPSGFFCSEYLRATFPHNAAAHLYVIGGAGLVHELTMQGFTVSGGPESNEASIDVDDKIFSNIAETLRPTKYDGVVVGFDSNFNFLKLCKASIILQQNPDAFLCATNEDAFVRVGTLGMPGNGSIATMVKYCLLTAATSTAGVVSNKAVDANLGTTERYMMTGKPDKRIIEFVMKKAGVADKRKVLMVGDRLDTDIQLALNAGVDSCFVLSGCSKEEELHEWGRRPTFVVPSVLSLL